MTTRKLGTLDRASGIVFDHALFDIRTNRYLRPRDAEHLRHAKRLATRKRKVAHDVAPVNMSTIVRGWDRLP